MSSSLLAGVSGLRAHQAMLDVVGNNLANMNTSGYKAERATFADMISENLRPGTAPTGLVGGTNPVQIGAGVRMGSIDRDLRQGSLQSTERVLDMAIQGEGFFVVSDGRQPLYTRVGTFDIDSTGHLVSTGTGFRVQDADGKDVAIDVDARLPAAATSRVGLTGNLDAAASPPRQTVLASTQPLQQGTRAGLLGGATGPFALADGMTLSIAVDGTPPRTVTFQTADFAAIGAATAAEVAAAIAAQVPGLSAVDAGGAVQLGSLRPGSASAIDVNDGSGSPAGLLGLSTTLVLGSQTTASLSTQLDDLPQTLPAHQAGDRIHLAGTDADGLPVAGTFVFGTGPGQDGTTVGDLVSFLSSLYPASTVELGTDGTLRVTADATGDSPLQVTLTDDPSNVGATTFSAVALTESVRGDEGQRLSTTMEVFDTQGNPHTVQFTLHKTGAGEWEVNATLPDGDGQVIDGSVTGIRFREDGAFDFVAGVGVGDARLQFLFDGLSVAQDVDLDLGEAGGFAGLTQFGGTSTAGASTQDGYAAGALGSLSVGSNGTIQGVYTNGQIQDLATIQVATFTNPAGLTKVGDSLLAASTNSGLALVGRGQAGRAGKVVSGALENSNVDVALEFTRLITAQRGFQVNARTITTTDQMLQELSNLVR